MSFARDRFCEIRRGVQGGPHTWCRKTTNTFASASSEPRRWTVTRSVMPPPKSERGCGAGSVPHHASGPAFPQVLEGVFDRHTSGLTPTAISSNLCSGMGGKETLIGGLWLRVFHECLDDLVSEFGLPGHIFLDKHVAESNYRPARVGPPCRKPAAPASAAQAVWLYFGELGHFANRSELMSIATSDFCS